MVRPEKVQTHSETVASVRAFPISSTSQTPSAVGLTALRSQGATHLLRSPRAFLVDLHSCTCGQGAFAFTPNEELAHAQCPRQSDTKPICLADEQQKTLSVKKLLADDKLERDNGQDNTVKPNEKAG